MPWFGGIARSYPPPRPDQCCARHQWLETKRKRKLEAHEVFSEDPALYRWQCWASTCKDPNSKDPTFVEDPRFRAFDNKVGFNYSLGSFSRGLFLVLSVDSPHALLLGPVPIFPQTFVSGKIIETAAAGRVPQSPSRGLLYTDGRMFVIYI